MARTVQILVPELAKRELARALGKPPARVRYVSRASGGDAKPLILSTVSLLDSAPGRRELDQLLREFPAPLVLLRAKRMGSVPLVGLQAVARWSHRLPKQVPSPYFAPDKAAVRRLLLAWRADATDKLIASAALDGDECVVWSCEPREYRCPVAEIPALAGLTKKALARFEVSQSGSRIRWPDADVDLGLDTFRENGDDEIRKAHENEMRSEMVGLGKGIRALRVEHGLKQVDIEGLSARQMRRLESGGLRPHMATIGKLANAHGMSTAAYLDRLAKVR